MKKVPPLNKVTDLNRQLLTGRILPGAHVVDATAGNGHDTLFLAQTVGATGSVIAFDLQEGAIDSARKRLQLAGLSDRCRFICDGHENISKYITQPLDAVLFNLGYLPGADKTVITRSETTLSAIAQSLELLSRRGIISLTLYSGHPGGEDECAAVMELLLSLDQRKFNVLECGFINQTNTPPTLVLVEKR